MSRGIGDPGQDFPNRKGEKFPWKATFIVYCQPLCKQKIVKKIVKAFFSALLFMIQAEISFTFKVFSSPLVQTPWASPNILEINQV